MRFSALSTSFLVLILCSSAYSGNVSVKGTHLCCGGCQAGAEEALAEIKGVSSVSCDLNTKVITFKAESDKTAGEGIKALAKAGFYGQATHGDKRMKFPASGTKKGMKANSFILAGVHLCCSACVSGSQKALVDVKGVSLIEIDRNEKTIKLTGDGVSIPAAVSALNKAGFYCRLHQPKKPKAAE